MNYNSYFILEELLRLVESNANSIGIIYLEILTNDVFPTFKEEDIVSTITRLFELGEVPHARKICNSYAGKGICFLNKINKESRIK